jgi:hypothetical protein
MKTHQQDRESPLSPKSDPEEVGSRKPATKDDCQVGRATPRRRSPPEYHSCCPESKKKKIKIDTKQYHHLMPKRYNHNAVECNDMQFARSVILLCNQIFYRENGSPLVTADM